MSFVCLHSALADDDCHSPFGTRYRVGFCGHFLDLHGLQWHLLENSVFASHIRLGWGCSGSLGHVGFAVPGSPGCRFQPNRFLPGPDHPRRWLGRCFACQIAWLPSSSRFKPAIEKSRTCCSLCHTPEPIPQNSVGNNFACRRWRGPCCSFWVELWRSQKIESI